MERLRTALMGLSGVGANYLDAIRSDDGFDLIAVADADTSVLRHHVVNPPVRAFDDYRSLVVEMARAGLDALVVAVEPFASREFVEMAAGKGIAVFHKSPPARNVRELERLAELFAEAGCRFVVARCWQPDAAFSALGRLDELVGRVHVATADVRTADPPTGWRGDAKRAGGGVLLNGAYDTVDLLVQVMGLPEMVYAQCAARDASPNYDTEDVATVALRFEGGRIGCLTADRCFPHRDVRITLNGTRSAVTITDDGISILPRDGAPLESWAMRSPNPDQPAISAFGAALRSEAPKVASTAREHLKVLAVIEAAYLSSETGVPESPRRFLGLEGV